MVYSNVNRRLSASRTRYDDLSAGTGHDQVRMLDFDGLGGRVPCEPLSAGRIRWSRCSVLEETDSRCSTAIERLSKADRSEWASFVLSSGAYDLKAISEELRNRLWDMSFEADY